MPHFFHRAHHLSASHVYDTGLLLVDIGTFFWMIAYVLAIIQGFRQKTYGIPLVAVCLNFTWEILAAFVFQEPVVLWRIGDVFWMSIDGVIVYQLFRFGRERQTIPEVRAWYYPILLSVFVAAAAGQYTFTTYFGDELGFEDAYMISIVMGALFISMFFNRREAGDLAYGVAWTKMFGTGLTSLALVFILPHFYPNKPTYAFMYYVYALCFLLDASYVALLTRERGGLFPRSAPVAA